MDFRFIKKDINGISWLIRGDEYSDILANKLKGIHTISQFLYPEHGSTIAPGFIPIKIGRRKAFGLMNLLDVNGKPDVYVKIFNCPSLLLKLKHLFVQSKAKKEFDLANRISLRGIPTVSVFLVGEKRRFGLLEESCLMVKKLEDVVNLKDFFYDISQNPGERQDVIEEFGRIARLSHDHGILQTDFALNNFLFHRHRNSRGFRIYFIDFERAKVCRNISRRKRIWLLAKLNRAGSDFTRREKFRFLHAYFNHLRPEHPISAIIRLAKELDRKTIKLLRKGTRKVWKGCVKGDRIFSIFDSHLFKGHFVNSYKPEELINLVKKFDDLKKIDKIKLSDSINIISADAELSAAKGKGLVLVHKLIYTDKDYPFTVWQDSNALLMARINVSEPIGVFIRKNPYADTNDTTGHPQSIRFTTVEGQFKNKGAIMKEERIQHSKDKRQASEDMPACQQTVGQDVKATLAVGLTADRIQDKEKVRGDGEAFLITSYIHDTQDVRDFFKNICSKDEKAAFLYRLATFMCNLHHFGGLISPLSSGDIVVKGKDKEKTYKFYLSHTYNFLLNMSLSHRERLLDIERIIHFLGITITGDEERSFRDMYSRNESWYKKADGSKGFQDQAIHQVWKNLDN